MNSNRQCGPHVVGFGELVFDHIFKSHNGKLIYFAGRGGGTVWNILANLASIDVSTQAVGVYGGVDPFGEIAKKELEGMGVEISHLRALPNLHTRIIFQLPTRTSTANAFHKFSAKCPICREKLDRNSVARLSEVRSFRAPSSRNARIFVFDRVTSNRLRILDKGREENPSLISVLDLGDPAQLRYRAGALVTAQINAFELVFLKDSVADAILRRIGRRSPQDLIESDGRVQVLVLLKGWKGIEVYGRTGSSQPANVPPPRISGIIDTAGAGDVVIATVVAALLRSNKEDLAEKLNREIVLESLHNSVSQLGRVLAKHGARGHLPDAYEMTTPFARFFGLDTDKIARRTKPMDVCPFCYGKIPRRVKNSCQKATNGTSLGRILSNFAERAMYVLERHQALRRTESLLENGGTYTVVGTGGSFPVACFIAQVISSERGRLALPMYPYDYFRGQVPVTDCLIAVSYSGATHECRLAVEKALRIGVKRIAIVTHAEKPKIAKEIDIKDQRIVVVSYGNNGRRERGFLSFAGTLLPSLLFARAVIGKGMSNRWINEVFEVAKFRPVPMLGEIIEMMEASGRVDVFGGYDARPAMLDLDAKLVEAGLCGVETHESKDFSHGRFMLVLGKAGRKAPRIFLQTGNDPYEKKLLEVLSADSKTPLLHIALEDQGTLGALALLIEVQFLIKKVGRRLQADRSHDITKPSRIPSKGLQLYRWTLEGN